jgi:hypothetical protein
MIVMWPPTALNNTATVFMKTKCKSNVLELYLYLIGLANWVVSLLELIIKTNSDHQIQQSRWPEKIIFKPTHNPILLHIETTDHFLSFQLVF